MQKNLSFTRKKLIIKKEKKEKKNGVCSSVPFGTLATVGRLNFYFSSDDEMSSSLIDGSLLSGGINELLTSFRTLGFGC